ncbi:MAG: C25 family peptidase propeptide domain-containing protein, partial [Candidatus Thorarchaeota archaeon]
MSGKESALKIVAVAFAAIIFISSTTMIEVMTLASPENAAGPSSIHQSFQSRRSQANSIISQAGTWVTIDSSAPGTPAEAHVTISDTSGITIVADFRGFWRSTYTIDSTDYDDLEMPGASSLHAYGKPMLPCLFEYVQIPYDVDVSIEVLSSTSAIEGGYTIRPAPPPVVPVAIGYSDDNVTSAIPTTFLDPVYSSNTTFPGYTTSTEGELNSTSMIMRGHRLLGLSFYPVQYNPSTGNLTIYSQLVVKVKYSFPTQIDSVSMNLYSEPFERIIERIVLNFYRPNRILYGPIVGIGIGADRIWPYPLYFRGFEYLIITTST